jgi:hypothetical protein
MYTESKTISIKASVFHVITYSKRKKMEMYSWNPLIVSKTARFRRYVWHKMCFTLLYHFLVEKVLSTINI